MSGPVQVATPESLLRPEVLALSAYAVPDASGLVKLDAMENPYSLPRDLAAELGALLGAAAVNRYPEAEARTLKAAIRRALPARVLVAPDGDLGLHARQRHGDPVVSC
jgi:histidinol-phosphate/aromatic aminotransferase/cobyric acid decarboxylase-like protein